MPHEIILEHENLNSDSCFNNFPIPICGILFGHHSAIQGSGYNVHCSVGCTKIWRFYQKITEPSQKLGLTYFRDHEAFGLLQDRRFVHFCKFFDCLHPNRSIIR